MTDNRRTGESLRAYTARLYDERAESIKAGDAETVARLSEELDSRVLDCGHKPSAHSEHTTGTAHTSDEPSREICWTCADKGERERMKTERKMVAYITERDGARAVTTWTGGRLARVTRWACRPHKVFGRATVLYYFWAVDETGGLWLFTSPASSSMYARGRKLGKESR